MAVTWFTGDDQRVQQGAYFVVIIFAQTRAAVARAMEECGHHLRIAERGGPSTSGPNGTRLGLGYAGHVVGEPYRDWQAAELEGTLRVRAGDRRIEIKVGQLGALDEAGLILLPGAERLTDAGSRAAEGGVQLLEGLGTAAGNVGTAAGNIAEGGAQTAALVSPLIGPLLVLGLVAVVGSAAWFVISNPARAASAVKGVIG